MTWPGFSCLEGLPGVGEKMAGELRRIGIGTVDELVGQNADELYQRLCDIKASAVDRCVLYVFRCAIYYAENDEHDPELLKWWNWKDREQVSKSKEQ